MKKVLFGLLVSMFLAGVVNAANEVEITGLSFTGSVNLAEADIDRITATSATITDLRLGSATFDSGIVNAVYVLNDLPTNSYNVIAELTITTKTLQSQGTTYITGDINAQPVVPRNIVVFSSFGVSDVTITSAAVSGSVIVKGIDVMGNSVTETLVVVSTPHALIGRSSYTYCSISSVTISGYNSTVDIAGLTHKICIGTGDKIGIPNKLTAATDIYKIVETNVDHSTTTAQTVNVTYNTFTPLVPPDGTQDIYLLHKVKKTPNQ